MRVLITGGTGFLGRHVARVFFEAGNGVDLYTPRDLTEGEPSLTSWVADGNYDVLVHCAANVGGIGLNRKLPATLFRDNMRMGLNVLDACTYAREMKVIMIGTTCSYPSDLILPFLEAQIWEGYPEATNAAYGVAKRALLTAAEAYRSEYDLDITTLIPANLYGPGDHFFTAETNHVIPALVRKFHQAAKFKDAEVTLWGDGMPTRDFLYVEDCARAVLAAAMSQLHPAVINVGTGVETFISYVATVIAANFEYQGKITWDDSFPNGQKRRALSTERARASLGFKAEIGIELGLQKTVDWYLDEVKAHG